MPGQEEALRFDGHRFSLRRNARGSAAAHFRLWYIAVGTGWIVRRTALLAPRVGAVPIRVEVRDLGFRWGSCSATGAVSFDWRLLQLPVRVTDYVIVHELGHLREAHHGESFRSMLGRSLPDWRERKEELEHAAKDVYWCHPRMAQ